MKPDLKAEINKRLKQAKETINISLNPDDPELVDQITLGDNWNDPVTLGTAIDMHPLWTARWSKLLKTLKKQREILQLKHETFVNITKDEIYDSVFNENIDTGMTANNAKPTGQVVDRRFSKLYVHLDDEQVNMEQHEEYLSYVDPLHKVQEKIDDVEIIVKAFESRTQMLIQLGGLTRSMMDNKIIITGKKRN